MAKRPPNKLETRLHQAALAAPQQAITAQAAEAIVPDAKARQDALNFLLGVGLFKSLKDVKGSLLFRAVTKNELETTKDLSGEENLILSHIKLSGNEGIWTKHLKSKTNLHQTIIDRCLKALTQKHLIKRVPSVQHPTRKIYMLESLEPSITLTGGPWYTDNELDTEFIQHLIDACYKFISDLSFPKRNEGAEGAIYPISNSPKYPTADHIRNSLKRARLTETELSVEHVEMLLNVLVLDGKIERIPAFGSTLWTSTAMRDDESEEEISNRSHKKRKHREDAESHKAKRRRKKRERSESGSSSDTENTTRRQKGKRKHKSDKQRDSDSNSDSEPPVRKKKLKKRRRDASDDSHGSSADDKSQKSSKKKRQKVQVSSSDASDATSSESESDEEHSRRRRKGSSKTPKRESSLVAFDEYVSGLGGSVYRAIKEEKVLVNWSEAPCSQCPSFEFCRNDGPVNPRECVYYEDWLVNKTVTGEDKGEGD